MGHGREDTRKEVARGNRVGRGGRGERKRITKCTLCDSVLMILLC